MSHTLAKAAFGLVLLAGAGLVDAGQVTLNVDLREAAAAKAWVLPRPKGVTTTAPRTFPASTKAPQPMAPNQMSAPASRSFVRHSSIFCSMLQRVCGATSLVKPTRLPQ